MEQEKKLHAAALLPLFISSRERSDWGAKGGGESFRVVVFLWGLDFFSFPLAFFFVTEKKV